MPRKTVVSLLLALALLCLLWFRRAQDVETVAPAGVPSPPLLAESTVAHESQASELETPRAEVVVRENAAESAVPLARERGVRGVVLHDASLAPQDLLVVLMEAARPTEWKSATLEATDDATRGLFGFRDVPDGTYVVRVQIRREPALVEVEGVAVASGLADDPRLAEIDVRGLVHVFEFEVFDELGAPFERANLAFRPSDGSATWKSAQVERGRARVVATRPELDVVIEQFDYRPLFESHVRGPRRFFMQRGIRVEVEVAGEPLPEGVRRRMVLSAPELRRAEGPSSWPSSASTKAQTEATFVLHVPAPARYEVTLEFSLADGTQSVPLFDAVAPLDVLDVEGQVFRIAPDPKAVAERLEYLTKTR